MVSSSHRSDVSLLQSGPQEVEVSSLWPDIVTTALVSPCSVAAAARGVGEVPDLTLRSSVSHLRAVQLGLQEATAGHSPACSSWLWGWMHCKHIKCLAQLLCMQQSQSSRGQKPGAQHSELYCC